MDLLEADPMHPVGDEFMRAAHTLTSSSLTTGFESVAALASALEKWLTDAIEVPPEFNAQRLDVTRRAVDAVTAMVQSLRGTALPYPREDVVAELESLRQELRAARHTGARARTIKMPGVVRAALDAAMLPIDVAPDPVAAAPAPVVIPVLEPVVGAIRASPPRNRRSAVEPRRARRAGNPFLEPGRPRTGVEVIAVVDTPMRRSMPSIDLAPGTPEAPPEAASQFEAGKDQRKIKDDVDRDLLPVFLEEAKEIIPAVSEGVRRWKGAPPRTTRRWPRSCKRHLHTLKGSARA